MTTLDDDTKLNELRGILSRALKHHTRLSTMFDDPASDVTSWADLELCLRKAVGMTDALSSLPAQAVDVTVPQRWRDVGYLMACIDDAIEQGYDPDVDGPLLDEIRAELKAPPSQPAAVGERADALWEQLLPLMQVEGCPPGDPYKDKVAALALIEAALVHRDQVKL